MPKVIRINMTDLSVRIDEAPAAWAGLGGRALTSTVVAAESAADLPSARPQQQARVRSRSLVGNGCR